MSGAKARLAQVTARKWAAPTLLELGVPRTEARVAGLRVSDIRGSCWVLFTWVLLP